MGGSGVDPSSFQLFLTFIMIQVAVQLQHWNNYCYLCIPSGAGRAFLVKWIPHFTTPRHSIPTLLVCTKNLRVSTPTPTRQLWIPACSSNMDMDTLLIPPGHKFLSVSQSVSERKRERDEGRQASQSLNTAWSQSVTELNHRHQQIQPSFSRSLCQKTFRRRHN